MNVPDASSRVARGVAWVGSLLLLPAGSTLEWAAVFAHEPTFGARDAGRAVVGATMLAASVAVATWLRRGRPARRRRLLVDSALVIALGPLLFYPVYAVWLLVTVVIVLVASPFG